MYLCSSRDSCTDMLPTLFSPDSNNLSQASCSEYYPSPKLFLVWNKWFESGLKMLVRCRYRNLHSLKIAKERIHAQNTIYVDVKEHSRAINQKKILGEAHVYFMGNWTPAARWLKPKVLSTCRSLHSFSSNLLYTANVQP